MENKLHSLHFQHSKSFFITFTAYFLPWVFFNLKHDVYTCEDTESVYVDNYGRSLNTFCHLVFYKGTKYLCMLIQFHGLEPCPNN